MTSPLLDRSYKGFPPAAAPCALSEIAQRRWNLFAGDLPLPLPVLKANALAHNLAWMQQFAAQQGLDIAPHGKTTMSPQLYARQLAAGAWGISFATVYQMSVGVQHGVRRVIIANQVLQAADLDGLHQLLERTPGLRAWFLVDSIAQVERIEQWQERRGVARAFDVLLEIGIEGKRTGCRSHDEALALARRVARSPAVQLGGIECYEGALASCHHEHDRLATEALMQRVHAVALACEAEGLFAEGEVLITAGGSAIFDLVARHLRPALKTPLRGVLRSGCYLTHDHGFYKQMLHCVGERLGQDDTLHPALEVWAMVQSCPEPGLAIVSMGKRDVSYDLDLPQAIWHWREGQDRPSATPEHWRITALNDQHAYLHYEEAGAATAPRVGDLLGCGISHPCTTFDKWRWLPIVDEAYNVVDAVTTHF